jgi:predicted transcriptional regulator
MDTTDGPKPRSGKKGIDWKGEPEREYVELGVDAATIAKTYGCSVQMVGKKRRALQWDAKRAKFLETKSETTGETTAAAADADSAKEEASPTSGAAGETSPRARTAEQVDRQERAFEFAVVGYTIREIAKELGVCTNTVLEDLAHEQQRQADLVGERQRKTELAMAAAVYQRVIAKGFKKSDLNDTLLAKIIGGAEGKVSDRSLDVVVKARERLDKIFTVEPLTRHKTKAARAEAKIAESEALQAGRPDAFGDDTRWEVEYHIVGDTAHAEAS